MNRGALLVNIGSPDSPSVRDVRKYLNEFLNDPRVIDAPAPIRWMIVKLFILPFRPKHSARAYRSIWRDEGAPLIVLSNRMVEKLREKSPIPVELAMRYGNPSIEAGIRTLQERFSGEPFTLYLLPLYPHYAMSTFESTVVRVSHVVKRSFKNISLEVLPPFFSDPSYIDALVESARTHLQSRYDHLLFSCHGLPERHIRKSDPTGSHCLATDTCCSTPSEAHATCYRHQVLETYHAFMAKAGVAPGKSSVAFQSRLGRDRWLSPSTADELVRLARSGVKNVKVISPTFTTDCLETIEELGIREKETFLEAGGNSFELIPALNDHPAWIAALSQWLGRKA